MADGLNAADFARLFETVEEVSTPVPAETIGSLPAWLNGSLVRAGPGKFEFGSHSYENWFDGMCILHKFAISQGAVSYCSRFIRSKTFEVNSVSNKIVHSEFGTVASSDPYWGILKRFGAMFYSEEETDNVNVNVFANGSKLMVVGDAKYGQVVNADNLATEQASQLTIVDMTTSHPHWDHDGSVYNIGSTFKRGRPAYHVFKVPPPLSDDKDGGENWRRAKILASLPSSRALGISYFHSFGMTKNYIIFYEGPVLIDFLEAFKCKLWGKPINEAFSYCDQEKGYFHVFRKQTGEKLDIQFTTDAYFFWHAINAFETDDGIVFDACIFKDFDRKDLFAIPLNDVKSGAFHRKERWRKFQHYPGRFILPLRPQEQKCSTSRSSHGRSEVHIVPERLLPDGQDRIDMPTINYRHYNGRPYRYFYGTGSILNSWYINCVGKVDIETKRAKVWSGTSTQFPSEAIFVDNPQGKAEDDGVLLVSVCDVNPENRDFLLCLDATTFTELARSYVPQGQRVPYSFHGSFMTDKTTVHASQQALP